MENIEHCMERQLNCCEQILDDERKTNDLKLSVGLMNDDGSIVYRLAKSRVSLYFVLFLLCTFCTL